MHTLKKVFGGEWSVAILKSDFSVSLCQFSKKSSKEEIWQRAWQLGMSIIKITQGKKNFRIVYDLVAKYMYHVSPFWSMYFL